MKALHHVVVSEKPPQKRGFQTLISVKDFERDLSLILDSDTGFSQLKPLTLMLCDV